MKQSNALNCCCIAGAGFKSAPQSTLEIRSVDVEGQQGVVGRYVPEGENAVPVEPGEPGEAIGPAGDALGPVAGVGSVEVLVVGRVSVRVYAPDDRTAVDGVRPEEAALIVAPHVDVVGIQFVFGPKIVKLCCWFSAFMIQSDAIPSGLAQTSRSVHRTRRRSPSRYSR